MTIPKKENLHVEFKSDKKKLPDKEIVEEAVGMANTEGGEIFLGVEDDGTVTGIHKDHKDPTGASAMIFNRTVPSLSSRVELLEENGFDVLRFEIPVSQIITSTTDGKVLRRRLKADGSPENIPMYPFEMASRLSSLGELDFSASLVPDASVEDLDPEMRNKLLKLIQINNGDLSLLKLNSEQLDKALGFTKEISGKEYITFAGLLIIGKQASIQKFLPGAVVTFQVLNGTDVIRNADYLNPAIELPELLEKEFISLEQEESIQIGMFRVPLPQYSRKAFREAFMNALIHRDYSRNQGIRILAENEGMTISSPGGFIEGVTLQNILTVEPHGRNRLLADILKRTGLVERTGRGVDIIIEETLANGHILPDYSESDSRTVRLFFQKSGADKEFAYMIKKAQMNGISFSVFELLCLYYLKNYNALSMQELMDFLHLTEPRTAAVLDLLSQKHFIQRKGQKWVISAISTSGQNSSSTDRFNSEEKILEHVQQNGSIQRKEAAAILHISESKAYRVLKKLCSQNKLILTKQGSSSFYTLKKSDEKNLFPSQ